MGNEIYIASLFNLTLYPLGHYRIWSAINMDNAQDKTKRESHKHAVKEHRRVEGEAKIQRE